MKTNGVVRLARRDSSVGKQSVFGGNQRVLGISVYFISPVQRVSLKSGRERCPVG
jgi:hypothetical protein